LFTQREEGGEYLFEFASVKSLRKPGKKNYAPRSKGRLIEKGEEGGLGKITVGSEKGIFEGGDGNCHNRRGS